MIPQQLKRAKVVPIFKLNKSANNEHLNPLFYRPISLLPIFSKILEKKVADSLVKYLDDFNLIYQHQYGYRKKYSTYHPMIHLMNKVTSALNNGDIAIGVFCDLQKAFDTCKHSILISKLKKYKIFNAELKWFENYLDNREQQVTVDNKLSEKKVNSTGVPQGSILGPILFLIYINDLPNVTSLLMLLFADDCSLLITGKTLHEIIPKLNDELHKMCTWFRAHELALHPEKTKFMIFTLNEKNINFDELNINLNYNNANQNDPDLIKRLSFVNSKSKVPAIKFLGVYIDPSLSFKFHLEKIKSSISKSLFIMKKSSGFLSENALTTLYYSLIHCHLTYCNEIWSCGLESSLKSLKVQQKKAIRLITRSRYNEHTEPLFKQKQILPLTNLVNLSKLKFMFGLKKKTVPSSFQNVWLTHSEMNLHSHDLRQDSEQYYVLISRLNRYKNFPLYSYSKIWNDLDQFMKNIEVKNIFENALKVSFLSELNSSVNCTRLYCPSCNNNT